MFRLAEAFGDWKGFAGRALILCFLLGTMLSAAAAERFPKVGRAATTAEIGAWDIDVRPDFKGLPAGSGTVAQGQVLWEAQCASCHGIFGESNEVFTPIVGGTTVDDIQRGRVTSLTDSKQPQRTTLMKVATLSSLYDYIYRAMPWNSPRSLTPNDTYAVLAFILNLAEIVPEEFTLSNTNMMEVQERLPNRYGMTTNHGLQTARGKPDVQGSTCMKNCMDFVQIGSTLPDYARNAHHNLADQNRAWGPYRGADTARLPLAALPAANLHTHLHTNLRATVSPTPALEQKRQPRAVFVAYNCSACHATSSKLLGPSLTDIAQRYRARPDAAATLAKKIKLGGTGVWGNIPMPPQSAVLESDIGSLIDWILDGKF